MRTAGTSRQGPGRAWGGFRVRSVRLVMFAVAALVMLTTAYPASAQPQAASDNPYQRGPDPTVAGIEASRGPFATSSVNVPPGNGFNGGTIYYPTDTTQ